MTLLWLAQPCGCVHEAVLTPECIEFCEEVDRRYLEVLTPAGVRRSSMVEELRRECPVREVAHV